MLIVYNPNASAVVVAGVQLNYTILGGSTVNQSAVQPALVPIGPGQTVSVPALSSINIGPMSVAMGSAASLNSTQSVTPVGNPFPLNPQPSQPPNPTLVVGATVYGSDGSVNIAVPQGILIYPAINPALGNQGGFFNFGQPGTNFLTGLLLGVV